MKDYNSNVSCLPGNCVNRERENISRTTRNYQQSDIFNLNSDTFKQDMRKKNIRLQYQSENEKRLIPDKLMQKPVNIRNVFQSQISIN